MTKFLDAALAHAERGWHVFPLRPGTKRPALHSTKHCPMTDSCKAGHRGWEQRATTDPDRIRAAWTAGPFNIGIATGPSGLVVIDLDIAKPGDRRPAEWDLPGVHDGQDVLAVLADRAGESFPVDTFTAITPSGGVHLFYVAPDGVALRNTAGTRLGWKVDTRAHGGYVVAPGSLVDAMPYEIVVDRDPAPLPGWLLGLLRPAPLPPPPDKPVTLLSGRRSRYLDAAIRMECERVHQAPDGQRNACLYVAAFALGQLVAGGALIADEHERVLLTAAGRHIAVGAYTEREARATIASGLAKGANRPRQVA
ncbi:bifunctional DNA primase/polymerase [Actinophytocola xanthii]|uniref:DNA primase n=1 Tax=Actinophytocola xanthii TaxID=1912961 RepID=A0A1Q8CNG2_9PSEU|nr:bifunctional DNA primase/polymerase [Actinophytocola xanthii]OLF15870.1 DNA primase [Actinophytocola xanthii]